jgi:hypothetical protein
MTIRYDLTADMWVRSGGAWVHENSGTADLFVSQGGGFGFRVFEAYRLSGTGVWQRVLHTDAYGPNAAPTVTSWASAAGGGGTRKGVLSWTEASGMPMPATAYDLYIYFYNVTDPTKNTSYVLGAGRVGTTLNPAGINNALGDECYCELSYQEVGVGGFSGPNVATAHIFM